jgi:hypothetical protein
MALIADDPRFLYSPSISARVIVPFFINSVTAHLKIQIGKNLLFPFELIS